MRKERVRRGVRGEKMGSNEVGKTREDKGEGKGRAEGVKGEEQGKR